LESVIELLKRNKITIKKNPLSNDYFFYLKSEGLLHFYIEENDHFLYIFLRDGDDLSDKHFEHLFSWALYYFEELAQSLNASLIAFQNKSYLQLHLIEKLSASSGFKKMSKEQVVFLNTFLTKRPKDIEQSSQVKIIRHSTLFQYFKMIDDIFSAIKSYENTESLFRIWDENISLFDRLKFHLNGHDGEFHFLIEGNSLYIKTSDNQEMLFDEALNQNEIKEKIFIFFDKLKKSYRMENLFVAPRTFFDKFFTQIHYTNNNFTNALYDYFKNKYKDQTEAMFSKYLRELNNGKKFNWSHQTYYNNFFLLKFENDFIVYDTFNISYFTDIKEAETHYKTLILSAIEKEIEV
jgi:hypothetical protein